MLLEDVILGLILLVVFWATVDAACEQGCVLKHSTDFDERQPLILDKRGQNYKFVLPKNRTICLSHGQDIFLACPTETLIQSGEEVTKVKCIGEGTVGIGTDEFDFHDLDCTTRIKEKVRLTNQTCANGQGKIKCIGYSILTDVWLTLITICYNDELANPFYSEHELHPGEHFSDISERRHFLSEGMPPNISANEIYKQSYQKSRFTKLLCSEEYSRQYIQKGKSFLARGHLTPVADFQHAAWQFSSFYYINTTPQWQSINAGNWRIMEREVREFSKTRPRALKVYTGTYGEMWLENCKNFPTVIFLAEDKVPVSLYLWKIVYCETEKRAIVFVVLNHPFVPFVTKEDHICPNICARYGWDSEKWKRLEQGYLICCNYHEFKHVVPYPKLVVRGILRRTPNSTRKDAQTPR